MFDLVPPSAFLIFVVAAVLFIGWGQRVLDRMRLTDTQAFLLLGVLFAGAWIPEIPLGGGIRLDLGGLLVPAGVATYLLVTAGTAVERNRALLASLVTTAVLYASDKFLPAEPSHGIPFDVDPLYIPALLGGLVGYLVAARSRRSAFIAATFGVIASDLAAVIENWARGVPGATMALGAAGIFDASVIAGFLAVALAEAIGEAREALQGGPSPDRPAALRRGLAAEDGLRWGSRTDAEEGAAGEERARGEERSKGAAIEPMRGPLAWGLVLASAALLGAGALWSPSVYDHGNRTRVTRITDGAGNLLLETGRRVYRGDEWIDEGNRRYLVTDVRGTEAIARFVEVVDLERWARSLRLAAAGGEGSRSSAGEAAAAATRGKRDRKEITVCVYHTHNDESYVSNEGTASVPGRGGIHKVGGALEDALEDKGFRVIHNEAIHLPHDRGAYRRSRRSAVECLRRGKSDMLIDVHRDAGSQRLYAQRIGGQGITQVRMVVGRQNENRNETLALAAELKAIADREKRRLVKGIYVGDGNYNQDLSPRAILLELGTERNARESAERGARHFADVLAIYLDRELARD